MPKLIYERSKLLKLKDPIVYCLSRKFGYKKGRYSMSIRSCSSLNIKISVIDLGDLIFFSHFSPVHPVS